MTIIKLPPIYEVVSHPLGFSLLRNSLPMRTPAGLELIVPKLALAEALVVEWRQQKDKIVPALMPMMQLAATTLDITSKQRGSIISQILAYAGSELLCHQVKEPLELAQLQETLWTPYLEWSAKSLGLTFKIDYGLMPIDQKPEILTLLRQHIGTYNDWLLTGFHYAINSVGSLILGLALVNRFRPLEEIFDAAELETTYQMKKWGETTVTQKQLRRRHQDLEEAARWLELI